MGKAKHPYLSSIAAVRAEYFRRWEATPITHPNINPGGPDYPVMFHRMCPLCRLPVSWQGWFDDLKGVGTDMGRSHWTHHAGQASAAPATFWVKALPLTRLIPISRGQWEYLVSEMATYLHREGKPLVPYKEGAAFAWENWPLMKRAGVPVFVRREVLLIPEDHFDFLSTMHTAGYNWHQIAADTYADMARARRKGLTP